MANPEKLRLELETLLNQGQFARALPLAERAARQNPRDASLLALYISTLTHTGSAKEALTLYHERGSKVEPEWELYQPLALARIKLNLKPLALADLRAARTRLSATDPRAATLDLQAASLTEYCTDQASARGVTLDQLMVEDRAREMLLAGRPEEAIASGGEWLERYPHSGPLRARLASAHYELGQLSAGLALCESEEVCPELMFRKICLLMAQGRGRAAQNAGRALLRYQSRTGEELCHQLKALLLLNQNRAVLKVASQSNLSLLQPARLCLVSAQFALGNFGAIENYLQEWTGLLEPEERNSIEDALVHRDPDRGSLRDFVLQELLPQDAADRAHSWSGQSPKSNASPSTLREVRKWLEQNPMMKKLAPYLWVYADQLQKVLGYLILTACPDDRNLVRRARRFIRSRSPLRRGRQQVLKILGLMGRVRSGAYVFNLQGQSRIVVVHAVKWLPGWTPDCTGKALELLRQVGPLLTQKRYSDAENLILRALEHAPDSSDLLYHQADIFRRQGREDESQHRLERCLELNPRHIGARLLRAAWLAQNDQLGEARALWRQVAKNKSLWSGYMGDFYRTKLLILQKLNPARAEAWLSDWRAEQPGHIFLEQFR